MGAWFGWEKFQDILRPKAYFQELFGANFGQDQKVVDKAIAYWRQHRPRLSFVYLGQVDSAGHEYGYGEIFTQELIEADRRIGQLLQALEETGMLPNTTVAIVSDHGRLKTGFGHGGSTNLESNTHMFLWGPSTIRRGYNISSAVSILDTSPTILASLGLGPGPSQWRGTPLLEAFLPESEAWHAAAAAAANNEAKKKEQSDGSYSSMWLYIEERPDADDPCRIRLEQGTLIPEQSAAKTVLQFLLVHFDTIYIRGLLSGILLSLIVLVCLATLFCGRGCVLKFLRGQRGWKPLVDSSDTTTPSHPEANS
ncbi:hypothetical protein DFQ26_008128 [Actinomortierella ambigua]|nr:hypothetical protein DFQ26_008128 [Actinomortierella ambigua]